MQIAEAMKGIFPDALIIRGQDDHFILIDGFDSQKETAEKITSVNKTIQNEAEGTRCSFAGGIHSCAGEVPPPA